MTIPPPNGGLVRKALRIARLALLGLAATVVLVVVAGFGYERIQRAAARRAFPPPGVMVDVGGHRLHLDCEGSGSPTVILEAGQDVRGSLSWSPIKSAIAELTRVCAYDRAGILWSEPGPGPRDSPTIAAELKELLDRAGEGGPYVMVGHSLGGIHIRKFADLDRAAVVGFVFVDASHPDQIARMPAEVTGTPPALVQAVVRFLNAIGLFRFVSLWPPTPMGEDVNAVIERFRPYSNEGLWAEFGTTAQSLASVTDDQDFGDLPLEVLTAGRKPPYATDELFARTLPVWTQLHEELAASSTSGVHQVVPDGTHYIQVDRPDVVIDAIRRVVEAARERFPVDGGD